MGKLKLRVILGLFSTVTLSLSIIAVLYSEKARQFIKAKTEQDVALREAEDARRAHTEYFDSIQKQKEELVKRMQLSKTEYESLLEKQPSLIAEQKKIEVKVVEEVVPVTTTSTKPKSTKKTKSS